MFQGLEHKFQDLVHMFQGLEYMFQGLEYKNLPEEKTFSPRSKEKKLWEMERGSPAQHPKLGQ